MNNNDPDEMTTKKANGGFLGFFQTVALIALIVGAVGSLTFMFREGQNTPRFLLFLFAIWVLAPFAALFWAHTASKRRSLVTQATLYSVELIVALGSLVVYSERINVKPAGSPNAFLFVAVPPVSMLFVAIVPIIAFISGRLSRRGVGRS